MIGGLLWLASVAFAQTEVCGTPYSRIEFGAAVGEVDDAYRDNDGREAKYKLQQIGEKLLCHDEVVDRLLFAKFARFMALSYFFEQDEEGAVRWGNTAKATGAPLTYDSRTYPEAFVERLETAEEPIEGGPGGGLNVPSGGGVFLDGSLLLEPVTQAEIPHLVQVFDRDQAFVGAYWQTGAAFDPNILGDDTPKPPKWWTGDGASSARQRDADAGTSKSGGVPVAPVAIGGGLLAVSGITYALASVTAGGMSELSTGEELTAARTRANSLVLVSGLTFAGAVGVGVGGVLVSTDGIRFRGRF
jgi:hypothetical protein